MTIYETLKLEHMQLRSLLDDIIEKSTSDAAISGSPTPEGSGEDWPDLLNDFKTMLIAHNRAEEVAFYDVLTRIPHRSELLELKTDEHHLTEELLSDLDGLTPQDYEWGSRLALVQNQLESHIAEEETSVFSIIQAELSDAESEEIAVRFEQLRSEIMQRADVRDPMGVRVNPPSLDI